MFGAIFSGACALAQGFAGLGTDAEGYGLPSRETRFAFPEDHGPHPTFRIEWWYVTANLTDEDGVPYGLQWTLFRNALSPEGRPQDQAWMAHAAISSPEGHFSAERLARGGIGQSGVSAEPFEAFVDEWSMHGPSLSDVQISAQSTDFGYEMSFRTAQAFVPQGEDGYSVKAPSGVASHYYSQPFFEVTGTLTLPSGDVTVSGLGWLDREWSSQPLEESQTGWDWMSLHLDTGQKLMGFQVRDQSGSNYTVGTWIEANGSATPLKPGEVALQPIDTTQVAGREVPVVWDLAVPSRGIDVRVSAFYTDSWMDTSVPYWEGPVAVEGTHSGVGYLEMTGYE